MEADTAPAQIWVQRVPPADFVLVRRKRREKL